MTSACGASCLKGAAGRLPRKRALGLASDGWRCSCCCPVGQRALSRKSRRAVPNRETLPRKRTNACRQELNACRGLRSSVCACCGRRPFAPGRRARNFMSESLSRESVPRARPPRAAFPPQREPSRDHRHALPIRRARSNAGASIAPMAPWSSPTAAMEAFAVVSEIQISDSQPWADA